MAERPPRRRDDDDEDDRPRKRRPVDDDEDDDDRPRKRRSRDDDDEEDDRPRKRRSRDDEDDDDDRPRSSGKPNWKNVKLGLLLATIGMWILFGTMALNALATLFFMIGILAQAETMAKIFAIMTIIAISVMMVAGVLMVIGFIFGSLTANKEGHMVFSILAACAAGVWLILVLAFRLVPFFQANQLGILGMLGIGGIGNAFLHITINLLLTTSWLMAVLYLRIGALLLKRRSLGDGVMGLIIMVSILGGLQLVFPLIDHATFGTPAGRVMHWILLWPPLLFAPVVLMLLIFALQRKRALL